MLAALHQGTQAPTSKAGLLPLSLLLALSAPRSVLPQHLSQFTIRYRRLRPFVYFLPLSLDWTLPGDRCPVFYS